MIKKNKVFFIGGIYLDEHMSEYIKNSKSSMQFSADSFQKKLIKGLKNFTDLEVVNVPFLGSYPRDYKKIIVKTENSEYDDVHVASCNYINVICFKHHFIYKSLIKKIESKYDLTQTNNVFIVYSCYKPFLEVSSYLKRKYGNIVVLNIVLDMPQYMNTRSNLGVFYKSYISYTTKKTMNLLTDVDGFVTITKYINDELNVRHVPSIVLEAISNMEDNSFERNEYNANRIMYAGILNEKYGIKMLIDAIEFLPQDIELVLCGDGDCVDYIKQKQTIYRNISFLGNIKPEKVFELFKTSDLLINPRSKNEFTKYSFPSKNMEYILSKTPALVYKLEGIPDEYDECFYYTEAVNAKELANDITRVFSINKDIIKSKCDKAYEFVSTKKNSEAQAKRILDLIDEVSICQ